MSARLEIEVRGATFADAQDAAERKMCALIADGWRFLGARTKRAERVVVLRMERADD